MKLLNIIFILFFINFLYADSVEKLLVYESPACGCCVFWSDYMSKSGFDVEEIKTNDILSIKSKYGIKSEYMSCHTAVIDGYIIEGHVPYTEVEKLLKEKPQNVIGISVPGMPQGSPGMEQGMEDDVYDVLILYKDGSSQVYATYRGKEKISN